MEKFLPIQTVADLNEIDVNYLKTMYHKDVYGNSKRFKVIDGKLHAVENIKYPLKEELDSLRLKALIIAHNENALASELSKLCDMKKETITKYFQRYTFKQISPAEKLIQALKTYISRNSIFPQEELSYE